MFSSTDTVAGNDEIVKQAQDGNLGAFSVIFTQYGSRVYGYLSAQLENPLESGDLTEEVFVKVWEGLREFEVGSQPFETHLYKMANQLLEERSKKPPSDDVETMPYIPKNCEYDGIYGLMRPLPRLIRQILILRHTHGLSYDEMSFVFPFRPFFIQLLYSFGMRKFNEILKQAKPETCGNGPAWLAWQETQLFPSMEVIRQSSTRLYHIIHLINKSRRIREYNERIDAYKRASNPQLARRKFSMQAVVAVVMIFVLLFSSAGTALASQSSLPGEVLYNTKLTTENVRLAISLDPLNDARLHATFALTRLDEIDQLVKLAHYQYLTGVVDNLSGHVEAVEALKTLVDVTADDVLSTTLDTLEVRLQVQMETLAAMQDVMPAQMQGLVEDAVQVLAHGQETVMAISPTAEPSGDDESPVDVPADDATLPTTMDTDVPLPTETTEVGSAAPAEDTGDITATPTLPVPTKAPTLVETKPPTATPEPAVVITDPDLDEKELDKLEKEAEKDVKEDEKEEEKDEKEEEKEDDKEEKEEEKDEKDLEKDKTK